MKREIDNSTITVGDFDTPTSIIDRTTKQKINKDIEDLKKNYKPTRPNRHVQNTPANNNRIHIFFNNIELSSTWNILQDRTYARS